MFKIYIVCILFLFGVAQCDPMRPWGPPQCANIPIDASSSIGLTVLYDSLQYYPSSNGNTKVCFSASVVELSSNSFETRGNLTFEVTQDTVPAVHYTNVKAEFTTSEGHPDLVPACFEASSSSFYTVTLSVELECIYSFGYGAPTSFIKLNSDGSVRLLRPAPNQYRSSVYVSSVVTSKPASTPQYCDTYECEQKRFYTATFNMSEDLTWGLPPGVSLVVSKIVNGKKQASVVEVNDLLKGEGQGYPHPEYLTQTISFDVAASSVYILECSTEYYFSPVLLFVGDDGNMQMKTVRSLTTSSNYTDSVLRAQFFLQCMNAWLYAFFGINLSNIVEIFLQY